jgi:CDP-paratose 2-epimerase
MSLCITGGAGFVGSSLARRYREQFPDRRIVAFDNLKRRGSEFNLADFKARNIEFTHGDVRIPGDLEALEGQFDLLIDASAEPSAHAGADGSPDYLIDTNLKGTLNCLEWARKRAGALLFLSTSRVYALPALRDLPLREDETRFHIDVDADLPSGLSPEGISETFDTSRHRSLYGATKLASELFVQEYCATYGLKAMINRCGVIAGPGQWGKVDQGVYTLWVARHYFGIGLSYMGFGGQGKQVRDLLHPDDLFALLSAQTDRADLWTGEVYNAGGGLKGSTSLVEYTRLCEEITGRSIEMGSVPETRPADIPYYVTDNAKVSETFAWTPAKIARDIVGDIHAWLKENHELVRTVFT